jgi:hypothetical protein
MGMVIRYVSLSIIKIIITKPYNLHRVSNPGQFFICDLSSCNLLAERNTSFLCAVLPCLVSELFKPSSSGPEQRTAFQGCVLCSCNLLAETNNFGLGAVLLSCLVSGQQKPSSPAVEPRTVSWGSGLCFCNILFETNNFWLGTVVLSFLVFKVQKPSPPGIEPRPVFRGCGLRFCNLLFETNNFDLGAVLLSCLVFKLHKPSSPWIELSTLFPEFWPCYILFMVSRNKHAKFGANWYIRSRVISEQTQHTLCNRSPFLCFIPVICWAPVDLDPREMVTPGSFNR